RYGEGSLEGFVLDANSGNPVEGAEVKVWARDWQNPVRVALPAAKTNGAGYFRFDGADNRKTYLIHARLKDQEIDSARDYSAYRHDFQPQPHTQTVFFTDRSLYRP